MLLATSNGLIGASNVSALMLFLAWLVGNTVGFVDSDPSLSSCDLADLYSGWPCCACDVMKVSCGGLYAGVPGGGRLVEVLR